MGQLACLFVFLSSLLLLVAAQCGDQTSLSTAATVSFPSTSSSVLCADPQYWRFTLTSPASVNYLALFVPPVTANGSPVEPEVNFLDSTGVALFNRTFGCGRFALCPLPNNGTVSLDAGVWYLQISRTVLNLPDGQYPYTLQLGSSAPCSADAFEPSSDASPRPISLSSGTISGNICPTGDVDVYSFSTSSLETLTFTFSPEDSIGVRLIDDRGTFFPLDASGTAVITAPGSYTLRVTANPRIPNFTGAYSITITTSAATCGEDTYEPNDTPAEAKAVALPLSADLTRCHWDDEDWFSFTLSSPQVLTVSITGGADIGNQELHILYPKTAAKNPELIRILPVARQDPLTAQFYLPGGAFLLGVPVLRPTDAFLTFEYPTPVSYHLSLTTAPFSCAAGSFTPGFTNSTPALVPTNTALHVCATFDPAKYTVADFFANELWFKFTITETSLIAFYFSLEFYDRKIYRVDDGVLTEFTPNELPPGEYYMKVSIFGADFWLAPNFDMKIFLAPSPSGTGSAGTGSQSGSYPWTMPPTTKPTTLPPATTQIETTQPLTVAPTTVPPPPPPTTVEPTTEEPPLADKATEHHGINVTPIILGVVLGTVAALGLAVGGALYYRWRQHPERPLFPWQHGERPVMNNNPAYDNPIAARENPIHV